MSDKQKSPRIKLIRDAAIFQLKLVADGIRDAILIPLSFVAALVGLVRGGKDCNTEFLRVISLGRRSEKWINLFGHQDPVDGTHPAGSMDRILEQVETVVIDQYRKGRDATETRAAVRRVLKEDDPDSPGKETREDSDR